MGLFHFARKKRVPVQGAAAQSDTTPLDLQAFILEPILTPSGLVDAPDHTPNVLDWMDHPGTDWHLASSDLTALPDSSHADVTPAHTTDASAAHPTATGDHDLVLSGSGYGSAQTDTTDHPLTGGGYGDAGTQATTPQSGDAHVNTPVSTTPTAPTAATTTVLPAVDHTIASPAVVSVVGSEVAPPLVTPAASQPLVGIIDTGFAAQNPHLDYSHITLGHDYVDGDNNPLLQPGRGNDHGTGILGIVEATQNYGVEGLHEATPLWLSRATGSGHWADALVSFVDHAQATGTPHAVVNFSFDLTQINPDGSVSTRFAFTPQELAALHYAHANHVLIVAAAGNQDGAMSALGQASQQFDNIITVGAADGLERAAYSSYGAGLDLLANGGTPEHPILTTMGDGLGAVAGSSAAAAQVTGAVSLVWQANPALSYRQVIELLEHAATDVGTAGWDATTGFGVINLAAAIDLAKQTKPDAVAASTGIVTADLIPILWVTSDGITVGERPTDDWSEPLPDPTSENGADTGTDAPATPPEGSETASGDGAQTDATPADGAEGTAAGQDAADQATDAPPESDMSGDEPGHDAAGDVPTDEPEGDSTENGSEPTGDSPDDANAPEPDGSDASDPPPSSEYQGGYDLGYSYGLSDGSGFREGISSWSGYSLYNLYGGGGWFASATFLADYLAGYNKGFIDGWIYTDTPPPSDPPEENPDPTAGDPGNDYGGTGYGNEGGGYGSEPSGNGYGSSGTGYGNEGGGYGSEPSGNGYGSSGTGYGNEGGGYGSDTGSTPDTQAPTAPSNLQLSLDSDTGSTGDDTTANATPVLLGRAEPHTLIQLFSAGQLVGQSTTAPDGTWQATTTPLPEGTQTIIATATDRAGNVSEFSTVLSIVIDTQSATPTNLQLAEASDTGSRDGATQVATPTIIGVAEPHAVVRLYQGDQQLGEGIADEQGHWAIATSQLNEGTHVITVQAVDTAGNTSTAATVTVTVDQQAPTASQPILAVGSDTGKSRTDHLTRIDTPTLTGTTEPNALVEVFDDEAFLGEATADASGNWQVTLEDPLPEGESHLYTVTTDTTGNVGMPSPPLTVTVDLTPPPAPTDLRLVPASDTGASSSDRLTKTTSPTVSGLAEPGQLVQLFRGTKLLGEATADPTGAWQITVPYLPEGTQTLIAVAFDEAANQSAATLLELTVDTTPPDLSLTSLYNHTDWTAGDRLSGWVINAGSPITQLTYQIDDPVQTGTPLVSETLPVAADGSFNAALVLTGLNTGQPYRFSASATDAAGNVTTQTFDFHYTTPTTPPSTAAPSDNQPTSSVTERLQLMLNEAINAATGNRKAALQQALSVLVELGSLVNTPTIAAGVSGVLDQLFLAAQAPLTQGEAKAWGHNFATQGSEAEESILTEVMQAKLLVTAAQIPALRDQLPTGSTETPLSTALKDLAKTYLATRSKPTETLTASGATNLLTQIWESHDRYALTKAASHLETALQGVTEPARAIQMVDRLLTVSQQTPTVQAQLSHDDVSSSLVDMGFAYARLNLPPVTDPAVLAQLPFQQLWQATDAAAVQAAKPGIQSFFAGFTGIAEQRTLVQYQAQLLDQLKNSSLLEPEQQHDPVAINNAIAGGTWFVSPRLPSPSTAPTTGSNSTTADPTATGTNPTTSFIGASLTWGGDPAAPLPFLPSTGAAPDSLFPDLGQDPWRRLFQPDALPSYLPYPLHWRIQVPVWNVWTYLAGNHRSPNELWSYDVISYGGAQILGINTENNATGAEGVTIGSYTADGTFVTETRCISCYFPTGSHWEPKFGNGYVQFVGFATAEATPPAGEGWVLGQDSDGKYDPYTQSNRPPTEPSTSPNPGTAGLLPGGGTLLPPGTELVPLDTGGWIPGIPSEIPPYPSPDPANPNQPNYPQPDFPPTCGLQTLPKPIADMDYLEVLMAALSRVPCLLGNDLKVAVEGILQHPQVLGLIAALLALVLLFPGVGELIAYFFVGAGIGNFLKGAIAVVQAKNQNNEGLVEDAAKDFKEALLDLGPALLTEGVLPLVAKLEKAKGIVEAVPVIGKFFKLYDLVGGNAFWRVVSQGEVLELGGFADKFAALEETAREAFGTALQKYPQAIDAILEFGPEAVDVLARRGKPSNLNQGLAEAKGLGENLEAWAQRLAEVSPEEGAEILDGVKYANEIRDTLRKPIVNGQGGGKIPNGRNVGFAEDFKITIPEHNPVTGAKGDYVAVSSNDVYVAVSSNDVYDQTLPVPENRIFEAEPRSSTNDIGDNSTDSEFKILNKIAQDIQESMGVSDIRAAELKAARDEITGDITIFTERAPCDACLPLIEKQWKDLFKNVNIKVVHGPDAGVIRRHQ